MKPYVFVLAALMAAAPLSSALAGKCDNETIRVTFDIPNTNKNNNDVSFKPTEYATRVRGYSTYRTVDNITNGGTLDGGKRSVSGKVDFSMICKRRRELRVKGECIITDSDGERYIEEVTVKSGLQGSKGDHNFDTISVCGGLAPEDKSRYDMRVKFCGFKGANSAFETLTFLEEQGEYDQAPSIKDEFEEQNIVVEFRAFNGNDKVRAIARRKRDLKIGQTRTFNCNERKGGCRFRLWFESTVEYTQKMISDGSGKINKQPDFVDQKLVYKVHDSELTKSTKTTQAAVWFTRMKVGGGYRPDHFFSGSSSKDAQYSFKDVEVELVEGTLACR